MLKSLFFFILYLLDTSIWIILKFLSGELLIKILKNNSKRKIYIQIKESKVNSIKKKIKYFYHKKNIFSSCLSKSIAIKLILDTLNVNTKLYFGISKFSNGKKIPHAWLVDPKSGESITPGLKKQKGTAIFKI